MKTFFAIILAVSISWLATSSAPYAQRRSPTDQERTSFLPVAQLWLGVNWEKMKVFSEGEYIRQQIVEVNYCCIDENEDKHIHIVDIQFRAKFFEHGNLMEEKNMSQRILFQCVGNQIIDWEPMPAYRLEEVT